MLTSVVELELVLFGRSRCEGPVTGFTLDKTEGILNDFLSVRFNFD